MEERIECWQLRSGTWYRDPQTEGWRLAASADGTVASLNLPAQDVGRMVRAKRDASTGQWFPSDFNYSPQSGAPLHLGITSLDSPWVPPFGAPALSDLGRPLARGLRQTPAPLALARTNRRFDPASDADRKLPALPFGQYRFLVHKFDVTSPSLVAIESDQGNLLLLLPESQTWVPLEGPVEAILAEGPRNPRGWRMELVEEDRSATLYLPTARGLAVVRPTLIGLSYAVEYFGEGLALGGPVAWAGEVWLPVLGEDGVVNLVGKPRGAGPSIVLPTGAPAPKNGFEAPVFDPLQVIWPSEEGQLVVRLDQDGEKKTDWIEWPAGLKPAFPLGCPYQSITGSFWQLCLRGPDQPLEYVQMGKASPERIAIDAPRLCTGHISYKKGQRIESDPWRQPIHAFTGSPSEVVVPLLESDLARAVVGLRIDAPQGVLSLLDSTRERHRAVLQLQAQNRPDVQFGTLVVTRPWLASLFVYDAHLWVYHPELPQALGWRLESWVDRVRALTP